MGILITVLTVILCVLLILVILVQNPKGGGLASGFSSANQIGGIRRTTDFLEKSTWSLLVAVLVLSVFSSSFSRISAINPDVQEEGIEELIQDNASAPQFDQQIPTQEIPTTEESSEENK